MNTSNWLNLVYANLAISLPIGIVGGVIAGLLTIRAQRWLEDRGKARAAAKAERIRRQYEVVTHYCVSPHLFTQYLIVRLVRVVVALSVVALFGTYTALTPRPQILWRSGHYLAALATGAAFLALCGAFAYVSLDGATLIEDFKRVFSFESWVNSVPAEMRDPKLEKLIQELRWPCIPKEGGAIQLRERREPPTNDCRQRPEVGSGEGPLPI